MKKIYFFISILLIIVIGIIIIYAAPKQTQNKSEKIKIVSTLFPLYDFAKNIGLDNVEVSLLLPPGIEAHTFEPKPSDIAKISEADIFIYTGKFMEPWVDDITNNINNKNIIIVDSSIGAKMIKDATQDSKNILPSYDPHVWLDFDNAKIITESIYKALTEKDPANTNYYLNNLNNYKNKLTDLDILFKSSLASCKKNEIIYGGHYAFGYLVARYNLKYTTAQGISPDSEPSAQDIMKLIEQIKNNNIQYVFYEELSSAKIAETLASETKTQLLFLNAAHNVSRDDLQNKVSFIDVMNKNLLNLKLGLECN